MKRKQLTKIFMMIIILKTLWPPWFIRQHFSALRVKITSTADLSCNLRGLRVESGDLSAPPWRNQDAEMIVRSAMVTHRKIGGALWFDAGPAS